MSKLYVACMNCKRFEPDSPKSPTEGYGWCSRIKREISKWCMCGLGYEPKEERRRVMANEIRQNGIEFVGAGGLVNVLIPYTDYQNASSAEVLAELQKDCVKAGAASVSETPIKATQVYRAEGKCGTTKGMVAWSKLIFMGDTLRGYTCYLSKVYDIIANINFLKKIGKWEGHL